MITVQLSPTERATAARIGVQRHALRMARGVEKVLDARVGNRERNNAMGAVVEFALAKHYGGALFEDWLTNRAYVPDGDHKNIVCDLGRNIQVRATDKPHGGLVVQAYDEACFTYVLGITTLDFRTVTFVGWARGVDLKKDVFWMADWVKPAFLIPQGHLVGMDLLPSEDL